MVTLVLLNLRSDGLYAISTVENLEKHHTVKNLTKHHTGNGYLDLHEDELDDSLLDILTNMEKLYDSVGGNVFLDEDKEILYVIDNNRPDPDVFRRGLYTTKDRYVEWDKLLK